MSDAQFMRHLGWLDSGAAGPSNSNGNEIKNQRRQSNYGGPAAAPQSGVTLFTDRAGNMQTAEVQIAADLAGAFIKTNVVDSAKNKEL